MLLMGRQRQGCREIIMPEFTGCTQCRDCGGSVRQKLAADWLRCLLKTVGISPREIFNDWLITVSAIERLVQWHVDAVIIYQYIVEKAVDAANSVQAAFHVLLLAPTLRIGGCGIWGWSKAKNC